MPVPSQVQKLSEHADQLQSALNGEATPPGTAPPETPPVNPDGTAPQPTPPQGQQQTPPANAHPQPNQDDDLAHKYKSLLGRTEVMAGEIKTLRSDKDLLYKQVSDLNRKLAEANVELETARANQSQPTDKDPEPGTEGPHKLDVNSFRQYGAEFGEMAEALNRLMDGQAPATTQAPPSQPAAEPDPQTQTPPAPQNGITMEQLTSDLVSDVYMLHQLDFNQINASQEFMGWLQQFDQVTGKQNMGRFSEAVNVRDKELCLQVITTFLGTPTGQALVTRLNGTQPPAQPNAAPNVQPDISTQGQDPATVPSAPQGKIWTPAEIKAFYQGQTDPKSEYFNNPDLARQTELDIMAAQKEGRIQGA